MLLQILLWILRIILFILLLILILIAIVMIVPVRYRVEGEFREKKPGVQGRVTWFFYLIHMKFKYEDEFHMVVRVLGFKVYDSLGIKNSKETKVCDIEHKDVSKTDVEQTINYENNNQTKSEPRDEIENNDTDSLAKKQDVVEDITTKQIKDYNLEDMEQEVEAL